ncbi:MAG: hypothetical protein IJW37_08105 [Lachnospiraceae bacterium]|nr:hypothetical protein [Lachnospiraceae bacterium]
MLDGFRIESDDTGTLLYDEGYGGAYVNDRMELVVLLAENTPENQARVREYTGYEDIIIESCEYSRNELYHVQNRLRLTHDELEEEGETEKLFEAAKSN